MSKSGGQPHTKADEGGQRPAKTPSQGAQAGGGKASSSSSKSSAQTSKKSPKG